MVATRKPASIRKTPLHSGRKAADEDLAKALAACRRRASALEESERSHRRFIENLTEGYFFYRHDRARAYRYVSPSITRILGYTPDEYMANSRAIFTDHAVNAEAATHTARGLAGELQRTFEAELWAKDGSRHYFEVTEYPVADAEGQVELIEGLAHEITEKKRLESRLLDLATIDELTGLLNRRHLKVRLEEAMSLANRHHYYLSLAIVDLDGLKGVNDLHGHAAGDRLICAAADILQKELRRGDIIGRIESVAGRLGGDEFAAILPYAGEPEALRAMQRVLEAFAAADVEVAPGARTSLRASIGIAEFNATESGDALQARADEALYRAKRHGRGRITLWREPTA